MNNKARSVILPLAVASALALSACSSNESETPAAATETAAAPADAANAPAAAANKALTKEEVAIGIEQVGQPTYNAADDTLEVMFKVTNNGKVSLPAAGGNNVSAGLLQLTPEEKRGQDMGRAAFTSDLQPGQAQELKASVPAGVLAGNKLQIELLQEGVAWFGFDFQQPVLILGPFARCADGKALCDAQGDAVGSK